MKLKIIGTMLAIASSGNFLVSATANNHINSLIVAQRRPSPGTSSQGVDDRNQYYDVLKYKEIV
ncbi:hypothetical protein C7B80_02870 [Cyanosarcina cf. burmensis CCALA 770]|nr:hypothetical protein C7B80_02870 [Cyanosarcina cf. burmensis CCALA 770]